MVRGITVSSIVSIMMSVLMVVATYMANLLSKKHYSGLRKIRNGKKYEKGVFAVNVLIFLI
jgi:hypothetical protein